MATDFIMPRMPDPQQQSAFFQHQQVFPPPQAMQLPAAYQPPPPPAAHHFSQQQPQQQAQQQHYNPQISPLSTSGNASPTSPKSYLTRPTRPMYMPAVLRPTEFPSKPPSKPKTIDSSDPEERVLRSNSSYLSLSGLAALGRLSRRSTGDSGTCVDGNWNLDLFPKPNGAPTRKHWKPDQEAAICDDATCKRYFSYFTRRHHCRKCGNIFCDTHSSFEVPLDHEANYNPRGSPSRACQHCFTEFKEWRGRTNSQSSSLDSSDMMNSPNPTSPILACSPTTGVKAAPTTAQQAMSVPRDWNWSTF